MIDDESRLLQSVIVSTIRVLRGLNDGAVACQVYNSKNKIKTENSGRANVMGYDNDLMPNIGVICL